MGGFDAFGLEEVVGVGTESDFLFACRDVAEPAVLLTAGGQVAPSALGIRAEGTWTLIPRARLIKAMIMMYRRM